MRNDKISVEDASKLFMKFLEYCMIKNINPAIILYQRQHQETLMLPFSTAATVSWLEHR